MTPAERFLRLVLEAPSPIALISHKNPDGDTIGSAAALALFLAERGKEAACLVPGGRPERYSFLLERVPSGLSSPPECAVALDVSTPERLAEFEETFRSAPRKLVVDHHADCSLEGDFRWLEPERSSTAEMMWDCLRTASLPLEAVEALYVGIMTDTGRFSFSNTSASTFEAAAEMVGAGVDPSGLFDKVFRQKPPELIRMEAEVLRRAVLHIDGAVCISTVPFETYEAFGAPQAEDLPSRLLEVRGTLIAALVLERKPGTTKISLRSRGTADAGSVARELGGGGHRHAAGAELECPPGTAEKKLLDLMNKAFRGGKQWTSIP